MAIGLRYSDVAVVPVEWSETSNTQIDLAGWSSTEHVPVDQSFVMDDLFVSYAREDHDVVSRIVSRLQTVGRSVWWDREIPYGHTWDSYIGARLASAQIVIVIWTTRSVKSKWVRAEANLADRRGALLPVVLDNVTPPPRSISPSQLPSTVRLTTLTIRGSPHW